MQEFKIKISLTVDFSVQNLTPCKSFNIKSFFQKTEQNCQIDLSKGKIDPKRVSPDVDFFLKSDKNQVF